jgi:hypothetical protein
MGGPESDIHNDSHPSDHVSGDESLLRLCLDQWHLVTYIRVLSLIPAPKVQFAAYKQFCDDTSTEKTRAIAEANERIDVLKADIQKDAADAALLTKEIAELDEDISIWEGDIKAATNVREIEKNDYDATNKDYSESVDALTRCLEETNWRPQAGLVCAGLRFDEPQAHLQGGQEHHQFFP